MTKHLLIPLVISLTASMGALAATTEGSWTIFPSIGYQFQNITEGDGPVYMLSDGNLFSLNTDDKELYSYTYGNKLTDTGIDRIFYNKSGKYLLVAYTNGNIDLIYDDGHSVNMPEVKDAILTSGHGINDAIFTDGRIYLATQFGFVVYDDERHEVIESGIYNINVDNVAISGNRLFLAAENKLYASPIDIRHPRLDTFDEILPNLWGINFKELSENLFCYTHRTSHDLYLLTYNPETNACKRKALGKKISGDLRSTDNGVTGTGTEEIVTVDREGNVSSTPMPEAFHGCAAFSNGDLSSVWIDTGAGAGRYDLSGGTVTVLYEPFRPEAVTMPEVAYLKWSADGDRLYASNLHPTHNLYGGRDDDYDNPQLMNVVEPAGGTIKDASVLRYDSPTEEITRRQEKTGWKGIPGGPTRFIEDPETEGLYYQGTNSFGFFAIRDGEVVQEFNNTNTPIPAVSRGYDVNIDNAGNLWLGIGYKSAPDATYFVLPAEKRRSKMGSVAISDWVPVALPESYTGNRDMFSLFCKKSNYAIFGQGNNGGLLVMDNNGTPSSFTDDRFMHHTLLTDNEGNSMEGSRLLGAVEDTRGQIWLASPYGVLVAQSPADQMNPGATLRRPIVARNDGTEFGDYLLDGECVYDIAVDHSNRKWIATETSGLYLVNEDGTAILRHFDSSNSPLTENVVYTVACDPHSNKVFVGTPDGLLCYDSDSSPAAEDYSEVYAYPNPVRPEYSGLITIAGLMDDSLVKIADIAGNVVYQSRSEGGMVTWDGCNTSGDRVRTGVYLVFASRNADGDSSGAVTKIMIVN